MTDILKSVCYSKDNRQPLNYIKTHQAPYRYLSFRDAPRLIKADLTTGTALDYGSGTGYSTHFLSQLGFMTDGVDLNPEMVHQAQVNYPNYSFSCLENGQLPFVGSSFDLVFSSFVLCEIGTEQEMHQYLSEARRVLKKNGLFVGITCHENLHNIQRQWLDFETNFPENQVLMSGHLVKLYHRGSQIEFLDYYWKLSDYQNFFEKAHFRLIEIEYPLGKAQEAYAWQDELIFPSFMILKAVPNGVAV